MTERVKKHYELLKSKEYRKVRRDLDMNVGAVTAGMNLYDSDAYMLAFMLEKEEPHLIEDDIFGFNRTVTKTPFAEVDGKRIRSGGSGNITPNYARVLSTGLDVVCTRIKEKMADCEDDKKLLFYKNALSCLESALHFADRYCEYAKEQGADRLYHALCRVPRQSATSFYEACVFMKFIIFTLRCNRNNHITFGGFDKYMYPYFKSDLDSGVCEGELFEILEDFFISLNLDTDLYFGVQQGDNGQSMVLGGRDAEGNDRFNLLSEMCLEASKELCVIDPKINLRVDKNTPLSRLELATELTKKGLGFPQYCNDDVVIPGLEKLGYSHEDACNYTVAACWEYIVEGNGADWPNIEKVNFPKAVEKAVNEHLSLCKSFEEFLERVKECVSAECCCVADYVYGGHVFPSPYLSIFVDDCIERGLDFSAGGAIYNNFGLHGVGIANAADAIAAVKKTVFDEKKYTADQLLAAITADFEGYSELRNYLLSCPKMGNNDDYVDQYADLLMDIFAEVLKGKTNRFGGRLRPGTGSAMEYLWSASVVGATADGRHAKAPFPSSFSPAVTTKLQGPLSCIQSFTKHDMTEIINGGPLTMEIHDNTFRNPDGVKKVAALIKAFIDLGGHQLQLNAINREVLLDAQKHPEDHQNLIVRVWGWSGYFNELHIDYQNHIISRTEFMA